ncbi:MAG: protein translocase subunit SecF [Clostridia bacterium]|nr:protein translocase subunit SecF [Clostridia bacterium]
MKTKKIFDKLSLKQLPVFQNAYYWFILPLAVLFLALIMGLVYNTQGNRFSGFANVGIDFTGGTVLTVEVKGADFIGGDNYEDNLSVIREVIENKGASVSTAQTGGSNAIIVRYKNEILVDGVPVDYNAASKTEEMIEINDNIKDDVEAAFLEKYGEEILVSVDAEMTNATASKELINKALLSVSIALLLMLIYIIIRFDLYSGIAAICAEFHDILMLFSLVIIFRVQINSSLIAAIITIVSYCINNTIVIFDRVRENVKPFKQSRTKIDVKSIVNGSVTASLTRTLFSSFTTLLMIGILAASGVPALTEFAMPIIFGLLAGLYSSNFIAPSIWGLMMQAKVNGERKARKSKSARAYR